MQHTLIQRAGRILAACAAFAALTARPAAADTGLPQLPRFPAQPTEVVIIGTMHAAQLEYGPHSPARIRALLNRIDPAAVGVETPPQWFAEDVYTRRSGTTRSTGPTPTATPTPTRTARPAAATCSTAT